MVLSRFTVPQATPDTADPASEQVLLAVPHPNDGLLGGQIAFGPDGYLYWGLGDGGPQGDSENNSQNPNVFLGKLLRLDTETQAFPYAIPPTNPFVGKAGYRPEILAMGLRNPWRFSFDRANGDLYLPDVGQDAWEEVNVIPAGGNGGQNFGWRIMEGNHPFNVPSGFDTSKLSPPAFEYSHATGSSIIGGFVYRGPASGLTGLYLYADFKARKIMGARRDAGVWATQTLEAFQDHSGICSFGEDEGGRLYAVDYSGWKIVRIEDDPNVRKPVLSPAGGTFANAALFFASSGTPDAVLHYTLNGQEPTESDPIFPKTGLTMDGVSSLKVKGFHAALLPGPTAVAACDFVVADPTIGASGGPVIPETGKNVSLYSNTNGAVFHYTVDGSSPTVLSPVYTPGSPIRLDLGPATVRAIAFKPGYAPSKTTSATWIRPTLATPILGAINTISIIGEGNLHYTLDGSEPTEQSPLYTVSIPIAEPLRLRAKGFKYGYYPSAEASADLFLSYTESGGAGGGSGSATAGYADSGLWYEAGYRSPEGICMDETGGFLVADTGNHSIRKSAILGPVSTLAGNGTAGFVNAKGSAARFNSPRGICRDAGGNVYVADDGNHVIRKIDSAGNVTTYAGNGSVGMTNGPGGQASFLDLQGLAIDAAGNLFAGSLGIIRKIDTTGNVSDFAVLPHVGGVSVAITPQGRMFATDSTDKVYEIGADGTTSLFAGSIPGYSDGFRTVARFQNNRSVSADALGILYICDGNKVRKIKPDGRVFTGYADDNGNGLANLSGPRDLAVGRDGFAWVADTGNHRIRRFYPNDWESDGIPDSKESGTTPFVVGVNDRLIDTDGDGQSNFVE